MSTQNKHRQQDQKGHQEKGDAKRLQPGKAPQTMGQKHHLSPDSESQRGSKTDIRRKG
jgi:hypothetical protein